MAPKRFAYASSWCAMLANVPNTNTLRDETAKRIADIRASAEGKEGLQSFLNKRPPNWLV